MPANWLPIEDWLANVLQEREDVRSAHVHTDGSIVKLLMQDGTDYRISVRDATENVPAARFAKGNVVRLRDEDESKG